MDIDFAGLIRDESETGPMNGGRYEILQYEDRGT